MVRQGYTIKTAVMPFKSQGLLPRIKNTRWVNQVLSTINHITGDVHYVALGLPRRGSLLTIHDLEMMNRLKGIKKWLLKTFWFDLPVRRVASVTVISEATKAKLLRFVRCDEEKIQVIPDAVSKRYQPRDYAFHANRPTLLTIGTKPNKNLPRLIESLRGLNVHLRIIGKPTDRDIRHLKEWSVDYSWQANLTSDELVEEYARCDILSMVSTEEGFGMPILEAQWTERPVITSNCSSMEEVAGASACLVDPFDSQSIRRGVIRLLESDAYRRELILLGRKNRERFTVTKVADRYIELYDRLAI